MTAPLPTKHTYSLENGRRVHSMHRGKSAFCASGALSSSVSSECNRTKQRDNRHIRRSLLATMAVTPHQIQLHATTQHRATRLFHAAALPTAQQAHSDTKWLRSYTVPRGPPGLRHTPHIANFRFELWS